MNDYGIHMVFSPQSCPLPLLDATLTNDRRVLAERILKQLRSAVARKTASHTLIVGPRGSGKTHLLAFVRKTLEECAEGASDPLIMPLAEEEHGLTTLFDFIIAALRSCGHDISVLNPGIEAKSREMALAEPIRAFDGVTEGRSVLILLENLGSIFAALEAGEVDRLRAFLQSHPRVAFLASAVELFADSSRPDHPFHGFFSIEPLRPLQRKEARAYLAQLAGAQGDKKLEAQIRARAAGPRIHAIYDLTGGNHRLLAMLSTFLTVDGFAELVGPFVQMVDRELTPYYQHRLDRLSPQQKKILMCIANHHGRALSVKGIAQHVFSTSQVVSRQLADLLHGAFVRRTKVGKESLYELNEPLLRLVLDIKEGRDRPLPLIVDFLRRWHSLRELRQLEDRAPESIKAYYTMAIEQALSLNALIVDERRASAIVQESRPFSVPDTEHREIEDASDCLTRAGTLKAQGQLDEAIIIYDEVVRRFGSSDRPELLEWVAMALVNKGLALGDLKRYEEEITAFNEIVRRFGSSNQPGLLAQVAKALVGRGLSLYGLKRSEDAIAAFNEVVHRLGSSDQPDLLASVAMALVGKGLSLDGVRRYEEAIAAYDEVVRQFGTSDQPDQLQCVALAFNSKARALARLDRPEQAIAIYDEVVQRFGSSNKPELLQSVVRALAGKASLELGNGHLLESLTLSEHALSIVSNHPAAVVTKIRALFRVGKVTDAIQFLRDCLSKMGAADPQLSKLVTVVLDEARENLIVLRELVDIYRETTEPLSTGLLQWIQSQLPMSEATARALEKSEEAVSQAFGQIPACSLPLQVLSAARHHALGDRQALFRLPLEIRRLVTDEQD